ncbi:guanine nucleotide-binding protein subunit gamma 1-like [Diospyros lotus]|uniref:guanine nucleotide-binding protein subunit gamma 1-like n=1 Tax=Diospyros lotus TaxID=55363 RepID=UPI00224DE9E0|nr:guanine nucleotide-binding protein subunit gamma 1-like [Diospyros lotus]
MMEESACNGGHQLPVPSEQEQQHQLPLGAGGATSSPNANFIGGKHRMAAAVAHLHQQIQIVQEELQELETLGESSLVCKDVVSTVESIPDALLPVTKGPASVSWDWWFQGAHVSRGGGRKRWI